MKMRLQQIKGYQFLVLAFLLTIVACKKDQVNSDFTLSRQFSTGNIRTTLGETTAKLEWNPSLFTESGNVQYTVEVSRDSLFTGNIELTKVVDTAGVSFTEDDLTIKIKYFARVKANGANGTSDSKWIVSNGFIITGEQILLPLLSSELTSTTVIFRWRVLSGITKITLTPLTGSPLDFAVSINEALVGNKLITGLEGGTTYRADIFQGTRIKGTLNFNTKPAIIGNIIDLTPITNRPNILADTLPIIPTGSIVLLKRGLSYDIPSTLNLSKSVTITSDEDLSIPILARINMNSNFNILSGSVIDSLVFRNVNISSNSYSSKYIFNVSNACTIGKIIFDGCRTSVFRGALRFQGSSFKTIEEFTFNNSIADSLSNYGLVTIDNVNSKVNFINLTNSTFFKNEKIITSRQNVNSILIDNCTFNEAPRSGNYLIDFSTSSSSTATGGIKISNTIFGVGLISSGSTSVRGIRTSSATLIEVSNTYATSDYNIISNPIPNLTSYANSSNTLFENPEIGNFKIKDVTFIGKSNAGDPRWRQ